MKKNLSSRLQANFFAGLAVVLPAVISIAVVVWLFGTLSNLTDKLLFPIPHEWKFINGLDGPIHWYWSIAALVWTVGLLMLVGLFARYYMGKKLIEVGDGIMLRVPFLNKIYSTIKQVKEAFAGNQSSFKQAVLIRFPHSGVYSLGFITSDQRYQVQAGQEKVCSVFVPTTPMPTAGFLVLVPEDAVIYLDMSVADAIKAIISLGSVMPEFPIKPVGKL